MEIGKEYFGPLWKFVSDENITDIDYNGRDLWLTTINSERYAADRKFTEINITASFVEQFCTRIANLVSRQFNKRNPELEAETPELRITILHESVCRSGRSISIRKTPPVIRLTEREMIESGFCSEKIQNVLINCVRAHMNITFCGIPGAGKTECVKFFSHYIPPEERVITIEDTMEIRYKETNPGKDSVELKVDPELFSYADAIKTSLRMNPVWIMLSEARSREVKFLLESWSTGVRGMTTLHTDDVRNVPDRIMNMMGSREDTQRLENDIYQALDVGALIRIRTLPDGRRQRCLDQLCFYLRTGGCNRIIPVVEEGRWILEEWPQELKNRFRRENISDPEKRGEVPLESQIGN